MSKKKLTLSINDKLINEARKNEINLSSFLEIKLREYLALIEGNIHQNESNGLSRVRTGDLRRVKATS